MKGQYEVAERIRKIREVFQHAQSIAIEHDDLKLLAVQLENTENEFRSVAYEGASMSLALKDLSNNKELNQWRLFMEGLGAKHSVQVHVGLGWAIAQQGVSSLPIIESLDAIMQFRVLDGCGYYDGIFRQRKTISNHIIQQGIESKFLPGYDQGIGRSLWYICKGEFTKIPEMIAGFSPSRHNDLWRGVGIACVYVGGYDENMLRELLTLSLNYRHQLSVGTALVSMSRNSANVLTEDTELACRVWCNRSAEETILVAMKTEPSKTVHCVDTYSMWLSNIEKDLMFIKPN